MTLQAYISQDRLRAIMRGEKLPDRTSGAALFADISGFTPLTEALRESLGSRRGAEELTKHLNAVYTALIAEVEKYGGSIIDFAGDAITCWFDESLATIHNNSQNTVNSPSSTAYAVTCAFALQQAMLAFTKINLPNNKSTSLALKVTVATGAARRFKVGDPIIHSMDALAGATVARTSTAEHHAQRGDILVDESTINLLGEALSIKEWRDDDESGERFAVVTRLNLKAELHLESFQTTHEEITSDKLQEWLHLEVYERERSSQQPFLTEFRPCVSLFVRFIGIDYDSDEAEKQLDRFIRQTQKIVERYEGTLLQIIIGDKGSYLYISLGTLSTHEDDARRALKIALELRKQTQELTFITSLQMGITQGMLRVGAYGGPTRRTYGALGDEVNLSARLMQSAAHNEILISSHVHKATENDFVFEPHSPLPMKGKTEPLPVFAVMSLRQQRAIRLQEPAYALPMVGRQSELQIISDKLELALNGQAQVIGIVAEAGMGKSRLVAEVIRLARKTGFAGYGGACQSDSINTPYQAWKSIWSAFFDLDPSAPLRKQIRLLEGEIEDRAPERLNSLPLLESLLNINIPGNDFTTVLEPKDRKSALHALLEDCLKAAAKDEPLLIVIEDMHWIDALSHDLLEELARATLSLPICFVLAYRPPQLKNLQTAQLEVLSNFTKIELSELNAKEAEQAIRAKLTQLYPSRGGALPPELVKKLMARVQGNPFFLEELLNFLRDRGLDPRNPNDLNQIELPNSLHTLILSRIDHLSENKKTTLRVASIVGRLFRADWLTGYYPALGNLPKVKKDLDEMHTLDITPLDSPEPELAYLFKHIVTYEVTYESLPFATRARFHELLANYLESKYTEDPPLETLAFHFSRTENISKKREYLLKSADAASAVYSNQAALDYYDQALALTADTNEIIDIHFKCGEILELTGDLAKADEQYKTALQIAKDNQLEQQIMKCQIRIGRIFERRGNYQSAIETLNTTIKLADEINNLSEKCSALNELGVVHWRLGEFDRALQVNIESRELAHQLNDRKMETAALLLMGTIHTERAEYAEAHKLFEAALILSRELKDPRQISSALLNWGVAYYYEGSYQKAREHIEESLLYSREIGDKRTMTISLNNLGNIYYLKNDYPSAKKYYLESLTLGRELANPYSIAIALSSIGITSFQEGHYDQAETYYQEALKLSTESQHKVNLALLYCYLGLLALARKQTNAARKSFHEGLTISFESKIKFYAVYNLIGCACVFQAENNFSKAAELLGAASSIANAIGLKIEPELQHPYEQAYQTLKETLDAEAFNTAWETGQQMTLEEAVAKILA